jgi:two-component system sensor histidine kinase AlgZ
MTKAANPWALALLWINLAVAMVMLVEGASGRFASLHQFSEVLVRGLLYANLAGLLGTLLMTRIVPRLAQRGLSPRVLVPLGIVGFTAVGGLLAQLLLTALGYTDARSFWRESLETLRVATPLALAFGLGAFVHASWRSRMAAMEHELRERQLTEQRLRKLAAEERLRSLEARLHPHFLFNTLNSISALIPESPGHAEHLVGRLAVLLRASLDSSRHPLIPLREELAMVESYLAIEQTRFGERLGCSVHAEPGCQDRSVPPMAVQSLVENAVKHGVLVRGEGEIFVNAWLADPGLRIEVRDTGPGFDLTAVPSGHGLDNLAERLQALFGDSAGLRVFRRDGQTVVEMAVPSK